MNQDLLTQQLRQILDDLAKSVDFNDKKLLVIGCSTSEIAGERIGTAGTMEIASSIFNVLHDFHEKTGVQLAFQCCEHLNRALVITAASAQKYGYEEVSVVPVRNAGGALGTTAFERLNGAVVVESIKADVGIDIGDTFIGMHLKPVAVPVRSSQKNIGHAHVTMAYSRPKLIGGTRAVYEKVPSNESC
ncbi:TIGR01440 family protein [Peribacillus alkalitolerans]|uniref:TIGR01440 family protein n=1 Tax=Peribacillus alkalitolerans TaxID=1550385 RepID=UPI0013D4C912|nr:TIGR01440 family protein [Peribacillus alkalitolerans]